MADYNLKTPDRPVGLLRAVEKLMYWSQISLPAVYGEELTYAKQQAVVAEKVNEVIEQLNVNTEWTEYLLNEGVENETVAYINELVQNGTLENLINNTLLLDINQSIDQLSKNLTARINQNAADIVTANKRIDTIIAGNQPSEGNSELIDIRTSATGTVYASAGEAVRAIESGTNFVDSAIKPIKLNRARPANSFDGRRMSISIDLTTNPNTVKFTLPSNVYMIWDGEIYVQMHIKDNDVNVTSKVYTKIESGADVLYAERSGNEYIVNYTGSSTWVSTVKKGNCVFIAMICWGATNTPVVISEDFKDVTTGPKLTSQFSIAQWGIVNRGTIRANLVSNNTYIESLTIMPGTYITYGLSNDLIVQEETTINMPVTLDNIFLIYDAVTKRFFIYTQKDSSSLTNSSFIIGFFEGYKGTFLGPNSNYFESMSSNEDYLNATIVQGAINVNTVDQRYEIIPSGSLFYMAIPGRPAYSFNAGEPIYVPFLSGGSTRILAFDYTSLTFKDYAAGSLLTKKIPLVSRYGGGVKPFIEPFSITVNGTPLISQFPINVDSNITQINAAFANLTKANSSKMKIVLAGDSITHGVGGTGFAQDGDTIVGNFKRNTKGYCWANLFRNYIDANFNAEVINNGCTGTTSVWWNSNKEALIPAGTDTCILMIGTNDRSTPSESPATKQELLDRFYTNLSSIVNYCLANNTNIVLMSPIPASASNEDYTADGYIRLLKCFELNEVVQRVAAEKSLEYINLYELFYDYCYVKGIDFSTLLGDGLHPNDAGYRMMFYEIIKGCSLAASYIPVPETGPINPITPDSKMSSETMKIPEEFVYSDKGIVDEGTTL